MINPCNAFNYYEKADANLLFFGPSNHAQMFDSYGLEMQEIPDHLRPFTLTFGDGEKFTNEELDVLHKSFDGACYNYYYEEGEMVIIDNLLWQHGRLPFAAPPGRKRNLAVILGDKTYPVNPKEDKWNII